MRIDAQDEMLDELKTYNFFAQMRKDLFQFLSMMVNNRPDRRLIAALLDGGEKILSEICTINEAQDQELAGLEDIHSFLKEAVSCPINEVETRLLVDWTFLFRGVRKGYGPPPPFEALYCAEGPTSTRIMRNVKRCYREAGLDTGDDQPSRPDFLGTELEFLSILAEQEAEAWMKGERIFAISKFHTAEKFREEHMIPWIDKYCNIAQQEARTLFYRGLLKMIAASMKGNFYTSISILCFKQNKVI